MTYAYKTLVMLILFFSASSFAENIGDKATIFDLLENDVTTLKQLSNKCYIAYNNAPNKHSTTKICGGAALVAMSFSAHINAFGVISTKESEAMVDLYISKHGYNALEQLQTKINEGNRIYKKTLSIYKSIIFN